MKTLSTNLQTEVDKQRTTPAFLVEILFDPPVRLSSRGAQSILGSDWTQWDVRPTGIGQDASSGAASPRLQLGNTDLSISTIILLQGIAGREVSVWQFYGTPTDPEDVVLIFNGVAGECVINADRSVNFSLKREEQSVLFTPRNYITRKEGFDHLIAPGTLIPFAGESYRLEPEN